MMLDQNPQIDRILQKFDAVEAELGSGVAGDDFVRLSKEYAELEPTVKAIRALARCARGNGRRCKKCCNRVTGRWLRWRRPSRKS
jgi:hypothetical protein